MCHLCSTANFRPDLSQAFIPDLPIPSGIDPLVQQRIEALFKGEHRRARMDEADGLSRAQYLFDAEEDTEDLTVPVAPMSDVVVHRMQGSGAWPVATDWDGEAYVEDNSVVKGTEMGIKKKRVDVVKPSKKKTIGKRAIVEGRLNGKSSIKKQKTQSRTKASGDDVLVPSLSSLAFMLYDFIAGFFAERKTPLVDIGVAPLSPKQSVESDEPKEEVAFYLDISIIDKSGHVKIRLCNKDAKTGTNVEHRMTSEKEAAEKVDEESEEIVAKPRRIRQLLGDERMFWGAEVQIDIEEVFAKEIKRGLREVMRG